MVFVSNLARFLPQACSLRLRGFQTVGGWRGALVSGNRVCAFLHCLLEPPLAERGRLPIRAGSWRATPPEQAAIAGAAAAESGLQSSFAEWIRARIGPDSRFYLVPSPTQDVAVYQWFTYRLLPSMATDEPQKADWLVFYGVTPAKSGLAGEVEGAPLRYATDYSIAKVRRAG